MSSFTSMLLPAEMQVDSLEDRPETTSGSRIECHWALAAVGIAALAGLFAALFLR